MARSSKKTVVAAPAVEAVPVPEGIGDFGTPATAPEEWRDKQNAPLVATSPALNVPSRSAVRAALDIAVKELKGRFNAQRVLDDIETLVPGAVK